jgi:flagellar protein FliO/FliZ
MRYPAAAALLAAVTLLLPHVLTTPVARAAPTAAVVAQAPDDETAEPAATETTLADDAASDVEQAFDTAEAPVSADQRDRAASASPSAAQSEPVQTAPPTPVAPAPTPPRADRAEPLDFPGAAVDVTLKLVAVLALAYVTLMLVKRYSLGPTLGKRSSALQVVESTTLAPNRAIYLVNVEGRRLLLGVTASQITTLAAWDGDGVPVPVPSPTPAPIALDEPLSAK